MTRWSATKSGLVIISAFFAESLTGQSLQRAGTEFQLNQFTTSFQAVPVVAADSAGNFVVAWESDSQDGAAGGVFARRFTSAGVAQGPEFQVNSHTLDTEFRPAVARSDNGFVVTWHELSQGSTGYDIFAQRFDGNGSRQGSEFLVNMHTFSYQVNPDVARDADGDFVIVWQSLAGDFYHDVRARRFASNGTPLAAEFITNVYTFSQQSEPVVAANAAGDFVIAWQSKPEDGSNYGVFARRFNSTGDAGVPFRVNSYTPGSQTSPVVAVASDGDFVIAWNDNDGHDGDSLGVFAQRFNALGAPVGAEFQVNTNTGAQQALASIDYDDADFVIAWQSLGQDGPGAYGIVAQRFSSLGARIGGEFVVNTHATGAQTFADVVANQSRFVIVWQSEHDGSGTGVFAQRFVSSAVLDIDGNGDVAPLTDGLLVLRYLFGFTGTTLTGGAVANDCTRCNAAAIEPYLQSLV